MNNFIWGVIVLILGVLLIMKMCESPPDIPDNSEETKRLKSQIAILNQDVARLVSINDSLETLKQKEKIKYDYRERDIDENIAKDSANSIVEYRKAMVENNWLPDGAPSLTFREIGIGAKALAQLPGLKLEVKFCEQQSQNKDLIIEDKNYIIAAKDGLIELQGLETKKWKMAYQDESSFWNSKELWFGLGVIGTTAIVFLTGLAK